MIIGIYFKTSYVKNKQIKPADDYMGHDYFKTSYVKNKPKLKDDLNYDLIISKHLMLKTNTLTRLANQLSNMISKHLMLKTNTRF